MVVLVVLVLLVVIIVPIVMIIVVKDLDVLDLYAKTQGLYQVSELSYGPCNENFGKTALSPHSAPGGANYRRIYGPELKTPLD